MSERTRYDVCIVGAGLVGLAVARALGSSHPGLDVVIVDKERHVAAHQSSHNSGVVHSGLYYEPGSLKAKLCVEGRETVYELAHQFGIPVRRCGKLVIASHPSEIPALDELERRGRANGLTGMTRLGPQGIRDHEPAAVGIEALHVPDAGVIDYGVLADHLADELVSAGTTVKVGHAVTAIDHLDGDVAITIGSQRIYASVVVNCAGLQSDLVADLAGARPTIRIVPFRGEYYQLSVDAAKLVRGLIYPVPDSRFPFLGVHFTRRIDDAVEVGPNAVLALGREHYRGSTPQWADVAQTLSTKGFRRLAVRHWRSGMRELVSSRSRRLYARSARRLVPSISRTDLLPGNAGVRAQAVSPNGGLVDDFVIETFGSTVHVLNAPSPGATASMAIGRYVAGQVEALLGS